MLTDFGYISVQWIWLGLVILFTLIELGTYQLVTVWFAIAALVMVFLSLLLDGLTMPAQLLIFIVISAALLIFTRPLAVKKLKIGKTKTNVEGLVGTIAPVTAAIPAFGKGEVRTGGQIWTAVSHDGTEIAEGTRCEILRVEGVKLIVRAEAATTAEKESQIMEE